MIDPAGHMLRGGDNTAGLYVRIEAPVACRQIRRRSGDRMCCCGARHEVQAMDGDDAANDVQ